MEFTSQICTTIEQSERLLALGLKKETADMHYYHTVDFEGNEVWYPSIIPYENVVVAYDFVGETEICLENNTIPAWSLHRLITMLTYQVIHKGDKYEPVIDITGMAYQGVCTQDSECGWTGDMYTDIIDCLEWVIKIGQFNTEYLGEE